MKRDTKIWAIRLVILAGIIVVFFFITKEFSDFDNFSTASSLNEDSLKFNSEEWKKERGYYEEIRPYMLNDLMTKVLVAGMDSSTIKSLLGKPELIDDTWNTNDNRWWVYRLGVYRTIESSYLQIEFDDKGKLKGTDIVDR
jgi:hypothetical protein